MRFQIELDCERPILLPRNYQRVLQGMIYHMIENENIRDFLHNKGFIWEERRFKPMVFSWLQGSYSIEKDKVRFYPPIRLYISSCWPPLIEELARAFLSTSVISLRGQAIMINHVEVLAEPPLDEGDLIVRTLSPITVYSTYESEEGRKVTYYYDVRDDSFSKLIRLNLIKKAKAIFDWNLEDRPFAIRPVGDVHERQQKRIWYKGFLIRAWNGTFRMSGDPFLKQMGYQVGLGGKNAQGFGMVESVLAQSQQVDGMKEKIAPLQKK
ncbi:CRISPR-associated endoribonuclease Cas6 [Mechercharimyces sp. CAU 1602]|uniref:CRISPR-associated endoribonuclease Cas6 n=1 Tax=Mechercharimyces sp. CAU 1602 TaxID=2973933 RepID=UPI0021634823|nr:CRISPR-associated endoribonuclease Cas6 [Mechercharimyces sp. CAU 1602]MCS1350068.1 CRISPR-associated endoribonuclease Cas6 [Mechercharimyces sp. CAU 1602]